MGVCWQSAATVEASPNRLVYTDLILDEDRHEVRRGDKVTLRLEGNLTKHDALAIARSTP